MHEALLKDRRVKIALWIVGAIILGVWANAAWIQKTRILDSKVQTTFNQYKQNLNARAQLLPEFIALLKNYAPQEQALLQEMSTSYEYSQRYQAPMQILTDPKLAAEYTQLQIRVVNSVLHFGKLAQTLPALAQNKQYFLLINQWVEINVTVENNERALNNFIVLYNGNLRGIPNAVFNRLFYHYPFRTPCNLAKPVR